MTKNGEYSFNEITWQPAIQCYLSQYMYVCICICWWKWNWWQGKACIAHLHSFHSHFYDICRIFLIPFLLLLLLSLFEYYVIWLFYVLQHITWRLTCRSNIVGRSSAYVSLGISQSTAWAPHLNVHKSIQFGYVCKMG